MTDAGEAARKVIQVIQWKKRPHLSSCAIYDPVERCDCWPERQEAEIEELRNLAAHTEAAVKASEMRGDRREAEMAEQRDLAYAKGDAAVKGLKERLAEYDDIPAIVLAGLRQLREKIADLTARLAQAEQRLADVLADVEPAVRRAEAQFRRAEQAEQRVRALEESGRSSGH